MPDNVDTHENYKGSIKNNFSRRAHIYDGYANVQCLAANFLIEKTYSRKAERILEIGCGTGNYTALLKERFPGAYILALDNAPDMIRHAEKKIQSGSVEFIVADAEEFAPDGKFDLITSNAAFQWLSDPERAIAGYRGALTEKGALIFSMFGPLTFTELDYSLKEALGSGYSINAARFLLKDRIETILKKYFEKSVVEEKIIKEDFSSLMELLDKIRCTGVRGMGMGNMFLWKKKLLTEAENIYRSRFGKIEASYQIFLCGAVK
jgi:malonyl-CoA O-methyltransferase